MLQFCADDSGSSPNQKVMVLAGLLAPAGNWIFLAEKWDAILRQQSPVAYFKYHHALRLTGEFDRKTKGWTEAARDSRALALATLIRTHCLARCFVVMRYDDFNAYLRAQPVPFRSVLSDHPYLMMLGRLMVALATVLSVAKLTDPCAIYLDRQGAQEPFVKSLIWPSIVRTLTEMPPQLLAGGTMPNFLDDPCFESDRDFIPLQAADFVAGAMRTETLEGAMPSFAEPIQKVRSFGFNMSAADVREMGGRIKTTIDELLQQAPETVLFGPEQR